MKNTWKNTLIAATLLTGGALLPLSGAQAQNNNPDRVAPSRSDNPNHLTPDQAAKLEWQHEQVDHYRGHKLTRDQAAKAEWAREHRIGESRNDAAVDTWKLQKAEHYRGPKLTREQAAKQQWARENNAAMHH